MPRSSRPGMFKLRASGVPVQIAYASNPSGKCSKSIVEFVLKQIPSSSIIFSRRSITGLCSLKFGMPKRNKPPIYSSFSNTVT